MDWTGDKVNLTNRHLAPFLLLLIGSFTFLYRDVIAKLVHDWYIDENYSHGFLVVPIAAYFVWERRHKLVATAVQPNAFGLVIAFASLGLLLAGILGAEVFTTEVSLIGAITGCVVFLLGWAHLRVLMFPIAFL